MVVHEDEGEGGEGEQAGGYGDQTMLVQRVSHLGPQRCLKCLVNPRNMLTNIIKLQDNSLVMFFFF